MSRRSLQIGWVSAILAGCGSSVEIDVRLVNPCNQDAVSSVDWLRFEPRGSGVDSALLATIEAREAGAIEDISIPLTTDFHLVVTGHKDDFNAPAAAIGVSSTYDLTSASGQVVVQVPFALVDQFYRTTSLGKAECSSLGVDRFGATATYLPGAGNVLVIGGLRFTGANLEYPRAVEVYDPAVGEFRVVQELRSAGARAYHTATLLTDGRVFIAGGESVSTVNREALKSTLIVDARDPQNVRIEAGPEMFEARVGHTAVRLSDGRVLIAGGRQLVAGTPDDQLPYLDSIEVYDPQNGAFTRPQRPDSGNAQTMSRGRFGHSATLLDTGFDVVVAGGFEGATPVPSLEVLRVDGNVVTVSGTTALEVGAIFHAAAIAQNGSLLLSGGYGEVAGANRNPPTMAVPNVEMFQLNARTGRMDRVCRDALNKGRGKHTVSMVGRRAVFIGGYDEAGGTIADGEVASLALGESCFLERPQTVSMTDARAEHAAAVLETSGEVLVFGGRSGPVDSVRTAEIFSSARNP